LTIFLNNAPSYWEKNLPVIPLWPNEKKPAINGWQRFADRMPAQEEQSGWLERHADANIGLPLGPQSGLVAVDIDSDDPEVIAAIERVLPPSPWCRVGRKGKVLIYKWRDHATERIRDENEKSVCEVLGRGTQIVIPPSIHPDTGQPYSANCELLDVHAIAPALPPDAGNLIRAALEQVGIKVSQRKRLNITQFVPAGYRDNALVSMAGLLAMGVSRGDMTVLEALRRISVWVENLTEKVIGDSVSAEKAQQKVIEFIVRDVLGEKRRVLPEGWDEGLSDEDKKNLGLDFSEEHFEWSFDRLRQYVDDLIVNTENYRSPAFTNGVDFVLSRLAQATKVNTVEKDVLLRTISDMSKVINMATLRKRLKELTASGIAGDNHAELAEAVLQDLSKFGEVRFHGDALWRWNCAYWDALSDHDVLHLITKDYGHFPAAKKEPDHRAILRSIKTLATKRLQEVSLNGVNFANGFLTADLQLHDHRPEYGCTYMLPYRYLPEQADKCSQFLTFLHDVWGDDEDYEQKVMALQEAMAASLFGLAPKYQRVFCCFGVPDSGKSRIIKLIEKLMPKDTQSAVNPADWSDKFLPAEMFGKLLNVAGELGEQNKIESRKFKEVVTGETITAQRKHGQPFAYQPSCAHWFSSNHPPHPDDSDSGFSRRWLFLTFNRPVPPERKVVDIESRLVEAEAEDIVNWILAGVSRLQANGGYTLPPSHQEQERRLRARSNPVRQFLEECSRLVYEANSKINTSLDEMYTAFNNFRCQMRIRQSVDVMKFREEIERLQSEFGLRVVTRPGHGGTSLWCEGVSLR